MFELLQGLFFAFILLQQDALWTRLQPEATTVKLKEHLETHGYSY